MNCFDAVYVMYLSDASDRYKNIVSQIDRIKLGASSVRFFPGLRFASANGFPSAGTRGCVMTFREIFREALRQDYQRVLILQDDCHFTKRFVQTSGALSDILKQTEWDFAYLGHGCAQVLGPEGFVPAQPDQNIMLTHCCAYSQAAMRAVAALIDDSLARGPGDLRGGPMYFDGYTNTVRAAQPGLKTIVSNPSLAWQFSSMSQITPNTFDRYNILRVPLRVVRAVKNACLSRLR